MKKASKKSAPARKKTAAKPKVAAKSSSKAKKKAKKAAGKKAPVKSTAIAKKKPVKKKPAARKTKPPVKSRPKPATLPASRSPMPAPPAFAPPPPPPAPRLPSSGQGTQDNPWILKTPPGTSEFSAYRDETLDPPALVVKVGSTELRYRLRCLMDLHSMLFAHGDWMLLGSADEQQPVVEGTVEAWARSPGNPAGGWYGLKPGLRGRFATYVPPVMEALGLADVEHFPRDNRMRAKPV